MRFAAVRIVWAKELRETLRDRRTLVVMLLFPLVVYPLISLLMTEVMAGKQSSEGMRPSRVAIVGGDAAARATLRGLLEARSRRRAAFNDAARGDSGGMDSAAFVLVDGAGTRAHGAGDGVPANASGVAAGNVDAVIDLDAPPCAAVTGPQRPQPERRPRRR